MNASPIKLLFASPSLLLIYQLTAIAQPTFQRGFPQTNSFVDNRATREVQEVWKKAEGAWRARDFASSQELWQKATRQANELYGDAHEITMEASAWAKRCKSAMTWKKDELRAFERFDAYCKRRIAASQQIDTEDVNQNYAAKCLEEWETQLTQARDLFGMASVDVANTEVAIATCCRYYGDLRRARTLFNSAAKVYKIDLGLAHPAFTQNAEDLAETHQDLGALAHSLEWIDRAQKSWSLLDRSSDEKSLAHMRLRLLAAKSFSLGNEYTNVQNTLHELSKFVAKRWGKYSVQYLYFCLSAANVERLNPKSAVEADRWLAEACTILQHSDAKSLVKYRIAQNITSGSLLLRSGNPQRAVGSLRNAINQVVEIDSPNVKTLLFARVKHAESLAQIGQSDAAMRDIDEAIQMMRCIKNSKEFSQYANAATGISEALFRMRKLGQAEAITCEAISVFEKRVGPEYIGTSRALRNLGRIQHCRRKFAESDSLFRRALTIESNTFGEKSRALLPTLDAYAAMLSAWEKPEQVDAAARRIRAIEAEGESIWLGTELTNEMAPD